MTKFMSKAIETQNYKKKSFVRPELNAILTKKALQFFLVHDISWNNGWT